MEKPAKCTNCGNSAFLEGGFGLDTCLQCGLSRSGSFNTDVVYWNQNQVLPRAFYTRRKRFKKYLSRAMRRQSSSTVPQETWEYLIKRGPYRSARHVQQTLKAARHLKRKCYDSLPFLTATLCPHIKVPVIGEIERNRALDMFDRIDGAIKTGPFVSYLFCLEFILKRMGRSDVCEHINRIQCAKRRAAYQRRLDAIFDEPRDSVFDLLVRPSVPLQS